MDKDPQVNPDSTTLYEKLGGEAGLKSLVKTFYRIMSETPGTKLIRDMHPEDISSSEDKLFCFLSGWTGGPALFLEKYGNPRLRARHLPFVIGVSERDQWMYCMGHALIEHKVPEPLLGQLYQAFHQVADHMRNEELHAQTRG